MTVISVLTIFVSGAACLAVVPAPDYTKDLVIYELNPKAFTSPNGAGDGSGSGTFKSLQAKLPYLQDLGVTAIYCGGYCKAAVHFYNIWTIYATVRPDEIDSTLGTEQDFKDLISDAHSRGIKVFVDIISHGVMKGSSLITEHPDFFKGGTWEMIDYDYTNPAFVAWWKDMVVGLVTNYKLDGFMIDGPCGTSTREQTLAPWDDIVQRCKDAGQPIVVFPELVNYHFSLGHMTDRKAQIVSPNHATLDPVSDYNTWSKKIPFMIQGLSFVNSGARRGPGNYYHCRGSRYQMGFYGIFTHRIPFWFGGEEFNADQVNLPNQLRRLYDRDMATCERGGWMYGTWLQWDQLKDPAKQQMLDDVKKLLKIRHENKDVFSYDGSNTYLKGIAPVDGWHAYIRYLPGEKAIVVAGNSGNVATNYTLNIELADLGLTYCDTFKVTDLWNDTSSTMTSAQLCNFSISVPPDKTPGGGVRLFKIEPLQH